MPYYRRYRPRRRFKRRKTYVKRVNRKYNAKPGKLRMFKQLVVPCQRVTESVMDLSAVMDVNGFFAYAPNFNWKMIPEYDAFGELFRAYKLCGIQYSFILNQTVAENESAVATSVNPQIEVCAIPVNTNMNAPTSFIEMLNIRQRKQRYLVCNRVKPISYYSPCFQRNSIAELTDDVGETAITTNWTRCKYQPTKPTNLKRPQVYSMFFAFQTADRLRPTSTCTLTVRHRFYFKMRGQSN